MTIEHSLKMDVNRSLDDVKRVVMSSASFQDMPDWEHVKRALNDTTDVMIYDLLDPRLGASLIGPDNGVQPRISIAFRALVDELDAFEADVMKTVVDSLKAFPDADMYLEIYSDVPAMLRKNGRLTLASNLFDENELFSEAYPYRAMFDMAYDVEQLDWWY